MSLSSLHLFRSHLDFFFRILIYISRYCLSRSCAVRENKTRTVKNLIFPKADSCWRGSIGGKAFEVCSVTPHIKSSLHHASSSKNKAHTKLAEWSAPPRAPTLTLSFNSSCFSFTSSLSLFFFLLLCAAIHFVFIFFRSLFCRPQISISLSQSITVSAHINVWSLSVADIFFLLIPPQRSSAVRIALLIICRTN